MEQYREWQNVPVENYNSELPDKEPDGSISNNLYVSGVDSIDQGQDSLVKDGSKLACAIKKRFSNNMFSEPATYTFAFITRSDDVRWDYEMLKFQCFTMPGLTWNTLR
jgi:hypothetical protein